MKLYQFLVACDFNRPALELLADLIWLSTNYRVSLAHTVFQQPQVLDQRPQLLSDTNTYIPAEIDPTYDAEFPGANGFLYYRIPLAWVTQGKTLTIEQPLPYSTHQVLDQVNAQLGLQLTSADVLDRQYTDAQETFELAAAPHSLVWTSEPYPNLGPYDLSWLGLLLLNGLVYLQPQPPAVEATILVQDDYSDLEDTPLLEHVGEINALYTILYGDPEDVLVLKNNVLRKLSYTEDTVRGGTWEINYYLRADLDSSAMPLGITFDLLRGPALALQPWLLALYKNGDGYGNSDLIVQFSPEEITLVSEEQGNQSIAAPLAINTLHRVQLNIVGTALTLFLNGAQVGTGSLSEPLVGKLGWSMYSFSDEEISFGLQNLLIQTPPPAPVLAPPGTVTWPAPDGNNFSFSSQDGGYVPDPNFTF